MFIEEINQPEKKDFKDIFRFPEEYLPANRRKATSRRRKRSHVTAATGDVFYNFKVNQHNDKLKAEESAKKKKELSEQKKTLAAQEKKLNEDLKNKKKALEAQMSEDLLALAERKKLLQQELDQIPKKKPKIKKECD